MSGRLWNTGLGMMIALIGLFFCWLLAKGYQKANRTRSWNETPCVIQSGWVRESEFSAPGQRRYAFEIRYRYEVGGKSFQGTQVTQRDGASKERTRKEKLAAAYPVGLETSCFVNPDDPGEAVLKHGSRAAGYTIWFPALFVVGGAGMAFSSWFRRDSIK
ncbi:MAG: DUF3592 domain-containing protein [Verrucomicrobiota bacterium]